MTVQAAQEPAPGLRFHQAATIVLEHLREQVPMGLWTVSRLENQRQSFLYLTDNEYGLAHGDGVAWDDTYCRNMVVGRTPRTAPRARDVPAYRAARVNEVIRIGAYIGVPIREPDGTLFGTVCGVDSSERGEELDAAQPLVEVLTALLDVALAAERDIDRARAAAARARSDAETDVLTGLLNRRGWVRAVAAAGERVRRLGDPTVVVSVDLDGLKTINDVHGHAAGDDHIRRAGRALQRALRPREVLARLGGDEFGMILDGCDRSAAPSRVAALQAAVHEEGLSASVGWAPVALDGNVVAAFARADRAMYLDKDRRVAAGGMSWLGGAPDGGRAVPAGPAAPRALSAGAPATAG